MFRVRKQVFCDTTYTGKNITVAVLDTGVVRHPDYAERIIGFTDFVNGRLGIYDDDSHGSHVTGILGGNGSISNERYRGIAPQCNLVIGKILNNNGDGTTEHMVRGVEWILKNQKKWNIRILNISVGMGLALKEGRKEALIACAENAWEQGLVVVVAAGNAGPLPGTISPIGKSKKVIAVGCHEGGYMGKRDSLCEHHSGRGDIDDFIKKPDIVAPGTEIISCSSGVKHTFKGWQNAYVAKTGTSMATPIVSGAAALYLEKYPEADNGEVKRQILYSATDLKEPWQKQGWGMVNVERLLV